MNIYVLILAGFTDISPAFLCSNIGEFPRKRFLSKFAPIRVSRVKFEIFNRKLIISVKTDKGKCTIYVQFSYSKQTIYKEVLDKLYILLISPEQHTYGIVDIRN